MKTKLRLSALLPCLILATLAACTGAQDRKQGYVTRGQQYLNDRNWAKARLEFRNALQIDAKDTEVQYLVGYSAEHSGEYGEAANMYRGVLDKDKGFQRARVALARMYALGGSPGDAIKLAEEGIATDPKNADLIAIRGVAKVQRGDPTGAIQDGEAAIALEPGNETASLLLGSLYLRAGRDQDALVVTERGAKANPGSVDLHLLLADLYGNDQRVKDAAEQLGEVIRLEPGDLQNRYRLAQFYVIHKDVDAAERTLRAAIAAKPDDVNAKLALANLIATQRSFEVGEKSLKDLAAVDPSNQSIQMALGRFYEQNGKLETATAAYQAVVKADPKGAQGIAARNRLATLAMTGNRNEEARKIVEENLAVSARDNDALVLRANIEMARGDAAAAVQDLRAVLRDQPNAPAVMRALSAAYQASGDNALAEETLRNSMRANPNDAPTRLELSQLLIREGRTDEAQPVVDQLVTAEPGDLAALEAALRVQINRKDYVGALKSAQNIQTLRPDLPNGYYLAGLVSEAQGKRTEATALFTKAMSLSPDSIEPLAAAVRSDLAAKQSDQALARIDAVIARAPRNPLAKTLKAEALTQLKRPAEAIPLLKQAIELRPTWWVPYHDMGQAELASGHNERAVAAYQQGLEATQYAPNLITVLGPLYEKLGRPEDALHLYDVWLERDNGNQIARNNLAMLLVTHKTQDKRSLDRALELAQPLNDSAQAAFVDTYGWVRYVRGEYVEAIPALQRAVALAPGIAVFQAHLGLAQYKSGMKDEAKRNLMIGTSANADFPEIMEARSALDALK